MIDTHIIGLFVLSILIIIYACVFCKNNENMDNVNYRQFRINDDSCSSCCSSCSIGDSDAFTDNMFPFWNSTRHTRNSSWDIRGDVPIDPFYTGPWWRSALI